MGAIYNLSVRQAQKCDTYICFNRVWLLMKVTVLLNWIFSSALPKYIDTWNTVPKKQVACCVWTKILMKWKVEVILTHKRFAVGNGQLCFHALIELKALQHENARSCFEKEIAFVEMFVFVINQLFSIMWRILHW